MIVENVSELLRFRNLLMTWTTREIKIRYKQSVLGVLWALLQPVSLMLIFTVVFGYIVEVPTGGIPYPIFAYSALLPWTFFSNSISTATSSLLNNSNLVTKVYFPREVLPLASIGAAFVDFLIAAVLYLLLLIIYRMPLQPVMLLLPLLLIVQIMLTVGVSLFASAAIVSYRDVRFVVPLALQLWMYMTPIVYPIALVPERLRPLYMLNPMAVVVDSFRRITLYGQPPQWNYLLVGAVISGSMFLIGYVYFKRTEPTFADVI